MDTPKAGENTVENDWWTLLAPCIFRDFVFNSLATDLRDPRNFGDSSFSGSELDSFKSHIDRKCYSVNTSVFRFNFSSSSAAKESGVSSTLSSQDPHPTRLYRWDHQPLETSSAQGFKVQLTGEVSLLDNSSNNYFVKKNCSLCGRFWFSTGKILSDFSSRKEYRQCVKISRNLGMSFPIITLFTSGKEERWCLPFTEGCLPAAEWRCCYSVVLVYLW